MSVLDENFEPTTDALHGAQREVSLLRGVADDSVRLARTDGDTDYFLARRGNDLCFFYRIADVIEAATCNPADKLERDVIYIGEVGEDDMTLRGVVSDAVEEIEVGGRTAEPRGNVFIIEGADLDRTLSLHLASDKELTVDLGSLAIPDPPAP